MTAAYQVTPAPAGKVSLAGTLLAVLSVPVGLLGIAWIVVFYVSQGSLPIAALGTWNLLIGFLLWLPSLMMLIAGIVLLAQARRL